MQPLISIFDGTNLIYKAFFGMPRLSTSDGIPTHAVFGALKSFRSSMRFLKPDYALVAWDSGAKTFRHKEDTNYKAQRPSAPDDLKSQFSILQNLFTILGIPQMVAPEGYECDDLIGTIATRASQGGIRAVIISSDKDFLQLCDDNISVNRKFKIETKETVESEYGMPPHDLIAVKALMGDKSDNIKGVRGIGPQTAIALVREHKTLPDIFAHAKKNVNTKFGRLITDAKEDIIKAEMLSTINTDIDIEEIPILPLRQITIDKETLLAWATHYEMNSVIADIDNYVNMFQT